MPKFLTNITGVTPVYKRRVTMKFRPSSTTADTAPDTSQVTRFPEGLAGGATNWKALKAVLRVDTPNASATSFQLYSSSGGNAAFGSGTAILGSSATPAVLSASGTSTYEVSTTGFTGTFATTGVSSDSIAAPQFSALGGSKVTAWVEWEEV